MATESEDLVLKLVHANHQESIRLANDHAKHKYVQGFYDGFDDGYVQGVRAAQRDVLQALGLGEFAYSSLLATDCLAVRESKNQEQS